MAYTVSWDELEPTILRQTLDGLWSLDDLYRLMEEANQLIQIKQERIDIITEVGNRAHLPNDFLHSARKIENFVNIQPHVGINVIVSTSNIYRVFYRVGSIIAPKAATIFRFADTVEKARTTIADERRKPPRP
jgi:hypothetical protein